MSGQWTPANPGLGSPAEIRSEAGRRRSRAEQLGQSSALAGAASAQVAEGWQSQAGSTFVTVAAGLQSDISGLSAQISSVADTLSRYANDVDSIQQQQRAIEIRQDDTTTALTRAGRTLDDLRSDPDADTSDLYRAQGHVEALNWQMRGFSGQLAALASQRSAADNAAILTLTGTGTRGVLAKLLTELPSGTSPSVTPAFDLDQLTSLSETELAALFALYPHLAQQIHANSDPTTVAAWWTSLSTAAQTTLVLGASGLIGSLGGVSPVARAAANRLNALNRLNEIDARLAELRGAAPSGGFSSPAYNPADEIAKLTAERGYMLKAVSGDVKLYLYEPSTDSIIEMIGTPGPGTAAMNTYIPGTYTSAFSFYNGGVQQVGHWLNERDQSQVTFVWKVGVFPGEDVVSGSQNLLRIGEANDANFALAKGEQIARFDHELRASLGTTSSSDFYGIGHSWGLGAITSAEVAGRHYDHVVSLAGAGMPEDWKAQDGTDYAHFSYRDALSMAQQTGAVWDGHNPGTSTDFTQHQYSRDGDYEIVIPTSTYPGLVSTTPPAAFLGSSSALDNHNLIAAQEAENQGALREVLKELRQ